MLSKKLPNIFSNFLFYLKVKSFRLLMENNCIQMASSAGHAVAYTISPIFKHIIDCVQLYFTNGCTNIALYTTTAPKKPSSRYQTSTLLRLCHIFKKKLTKFRKYVKCNFTVPFR